MARRGDLGPPDVAHGCSRVGIRQFGVGRPEAADLVLLAGADGAGDPTLVDHIDDRLNPQAVAEGSNLVHCDLNLRSSSTEAK
jgi:ABC-type uncharacterized transport system ATPase subunit